MFVITATTKGSIVHDLKMEFRTGYWEAETFSNCDVHTSIWNLGVHLSYRNECPGICAATEACSSFGWTDIGNYLN
jgi:hypothetical protein